MSSWEDWGDREPEDEEEQRPTAPRRHVVQRYNKNGTRVGKPMAFVATSRAEALEKAHRKWPRSFVRYCREEK